MQTTSSFHHLAHFVIFQHRRLLIDTNLEMITSYFSSKGKKGTDASEDADSDRKRGRNGGASGPNTSASSSGTGSSSSAKRIKSSSAPSSSSSSASTKPTAAIFGGSSAASKATGPLSDEVKELISSFDIHDANNDADGANTNNTWRKALDKHVRKPSFSTLAKFVASQRKSGKPIYPPPADVFSALTLTPLDNVKVVIVGQDPYHGPGQGHGLAFSVRRGIAIPPSLRNIYKELMDDDEVDFPDKRPMHGYLEKWARQGVLMLNTVLTVRGGEANSHKNRGWEAFTDECIRIVDRESRSRTSETGKRGIVFLLWGKPASKKVEGVISTKNGHEIIATSHPSPLGASKTNSPFLGSKCFSRANKALIERGMDPIDWNVD